MEFLLLDVEILTAIGKRTSAQGRIQACWLREARKL
jgi:hypothetical protein